MRSSRALGRFLRAPIPCWLGLFAWLFGLLVGAAALATFQASGALAPPPIGGSVVTESESDLLLTVREPYLTALAAHQASQLQDAVTLENVRVDLQPSQRALLLGEVRFMGQRFRISTQMYVTHQAGRVQIQAGDVLVGTLRLPFDANAVIAEPLNRELARMVEASRFDVLDVVTAEDRLIVRLAARDQIGADR